MSGKNEHGFVDGRSREVGCESAQNLEHRSTLLWDEAKAFAESLRAHAVSMRQVALMRCKGSGS